MMHINKILRPFSFILLMAMVVHADDINGISMNFVTVGNEGNAADTDSDPERNGYGAVSYTYRIGLTEVSIAQFLASGISDGNANYWNDGIRNLGPNAPVVSISWHEAARYCNWLTSGDVNTGAYTIDGSGEVTAVMSRNALLAAGTLFYVLPTEDEWYKAAYYTGSGYSLFANGTSTPPVHGVDANFDAAGGYTDGPAWVVGSGSVETNNGTLNMMGNVWEWLESAEDGILDNIGEPLAFRGGSYHQGSGLLGANRKGGSELPSAEYLNTGLRIVSIPEPGTISLMSLSTLGLFATRSLRRRRLTGKSLLPVSREHLCDTFLTQKEWADAFEERDYEQDTRSIMCTLTQQAKALSIWGAAREAYKEYDRKFWDYMVVAHERRKARKKAFKTALKRNTLYLLDAFLARIMK